MNRHISSRSKKIKAEDLLLKIGILAAFIIVAVIIILIATAFSKDNTKVAKAASNTQTVTTYQAVSVSEGDSLWTIASKYCPDYSDDTSATVQMLINLNSLSNEQIHIGGHILVPVENEV